MPKPPDPIRLQQGVQNIAYQTEQILNDFDQHDAVPSNCGYPTRRRRDAAGAAFANDIGPLDLPIG